MNSLGHLKTSGSAAAGCLFVRSGSLTAFRARRFDAPKHSLVEERVAQSSQGRVCMLQ